MGYLEKDKADEHKCYKPVASPRVENMNQLESEREALTDGSIELLSIPAQ